jgi:hypothetical protein
MPVMLTVAASTEIFVKLTSGLDVNVNVRLAGCEFPPPPVPPPPPVVVWLPLPLHPATAVIATQNTYPTLRLRFILTPRGRCVISLISAHPDCNSNLTRPSVRIGRKSFCVVQIMPKHVSEEPHTARGRYPMRGYVKVTIHLLL